MQTVHAARVGKSGTQESVHLVEGAWSCYTGTPRMRSALSVFAAMCMWHMYRYMYCTCTCTVRTCTCTVRIYVHVCDKFPLRRCSLLVLVTNSAHALVVCSIRRTPKWPVRMRVAPEGLLVLMCSQSSIGKPVCDHALGGVFCCK